MTRRPAESEVVALYVEQRLSLRAVARELDTNHHTVRRVLEAAGVPLDPTHRHPQHTDGAKQKMRDAKVGRVGWNRGQQMSEAHRRSNMRAKMKTSIDLAVYNDFERLLFLTRYLSVYKSTLGRDDDARRAFLDRFYFDPAFNAVYDLWISSGRDRWHMPTLDHMTPRSRGGDNNIANLRFVTWFENRTKGAMTLAEWMSFRAETGTVSNLFIEHVVAAYGGGK